MPADRPAPPVDNSPRPAEAAPRSRKAAMAVSRRLRAFAFDPLLSGQIDTMGVNEITLSVKWEEKLGPGPVGEYLEVIDHDPAGGTYYAPVDLNDPLLLATDGLAPSEGNPQFHQQMVYAVAMTTIRHFEEALGRKALWAPRKPFEARRKRGPDEYVQRLRIYPHALREANAFYSPQKCAALVRIFPGFIRRAGPKLARRNGFHVLVTRHRRPRDDARVARRHAP